MKKLVIASMIAISSASAFANTPEQEVADCNGLFLYFADLASRVDRSQQQTLLRSIKDTGIAPTKTLYNKLAEYYGNPHQTMGMAESIQFQKDLMTNSSALNKKMSSCDKTIKSHMASKPKKTLSF